MEKKLPFRTNLACRHPIPNQNFTLVSENARIWSQKFSIFKIEDSRALLSFLSTLSGRVGPNVLDNNNTQVFIARKYATYDALMKDLEVWKTLNSVQTTR